MSGYFAVDQHSVDSEQRGMASCPKLVVALKCGYEPARHPLASARRKRDTRFNSTQGGFLFFGRGTRSNRLPGDGACRQNVLIQERWRDFQRGRNVIEAITDVICGK